MKRSLANLLAAGRELVVVHHGKHGINTVHEVFRSDVRSGAHVISLDDDVDSCFADLELSGRELHRYRFPSTVRVSDCVDPSSLDGQNLISFFLERKFCSIEPRTVDAVRQFLRDKYAPKFIMTHDVGIFVVTST